MELYIRMGQPFFFGPRAQICHGLYVFLALVPSGINYDETMPSSTSTNCFTSSTVNLSAESRDSK